MKRTLQIVLISHLKNYIVEKDENSHDMEASVKGIQSRLGSSSLKRGAEYKVF